MFLAVEIKMWKHKPTTIILTRYQNCEMQLLGSSCLYVSPSVRLSARNNYAHIGRVSLKTDVSIFFENPSKKFKFRWNLTRIKGTVLKDRHTFMSYIAELCGMRNISDKIGRENQTRILCSTDSFFSLSKMVPFMTWNGGILYSRTGHRWQYGACALNAV